MKESFWIQTLEALALSGVNTDPQQKKALWASLTHALSLPLSLSLSLSPLSVVIQCSGSISSYLWSPPMIGTSHLWRWSLIRGLGSNPTKQQLVEHQWWEKSAWGRLITAAMSQHYRTTYSKTFLSSHLNMAVTCTLRSACKSPELQGHIVCTLFSC